MSDSRSFWIWLVFSLGLVIVLLCGPCTLLFGGGALISLLRGEDGQLAGMILVTALVIGGVPTVGGIVLMRNAWSSLKKERQARSGWQDAP